MAKGLFASLIIGTIIQQIGNLSGLMELVTFGNVARFMMGPAIGAGIAITRGGKMFTVLAAIAAGAIGAGTVVLTEGIATGVRIGEPVGAMLAAIVAIEIGKIIEGKTKFDLLIVPAAMVGAATIVGLFVSPHIATFMSFIGEQITNATYIAPIPMGLLIATIVGILLTGPLSSAAICVAIGIGGATGEGGTIAAGAALAGGAAQMVGFAVMSYRENKLSGLISQGLGTSMLQFPNVIKNPWVWLPPMVASAVGGLTVGLLYQLQGFRFATDSVGAGMGTSGLVGPFTAFAEMGNSTVTWISIIGILFILPALASLTICEIMRKKGLIKPGDLKI